MRVYRYEGRWWHGGICQIGWKPDYKPRLADYVSEIVWLMRNGRCDFGWNYPELVFGIGREWYDGPIWYANFGIFGFSIACI